MGPIEGSDDIGTEPNGLNVTFKFTFIDPSQ
jgi:hypothetical protein